MGQRCRVFGSSEKVGNEIKITAWSDGPGMAIDGLADLSQCLRLHHRRTVCGHVESTSQLEVHVRQSSDELASVDRKTKYFRLKNVNFAASGRYVADGLN